MGNAFLLMHLVVRFFPLHSPLDPKQKCEDVTDIDDRNRIDWLEHLLLLLHRHPQKLIFYSYVTECWDNTGIVPRKYSHIRLFPPNSSVQEILILEKLIRVAPNTRKNSENLQHVKNFLNPHHSKNTFDHVLELLNLIVIERQLHL